MGSGKEFLGILILGSGRTARLMATESTNGRTATGTKANGGTASNMARELTSLPMATPTLASISLGSRMDLVSISGRMGALTWVSSRTD